MEARRGIYGDGEERQYIALLIGVVRKRQCANFLRLFFDYNHPQLRGKSFAAKNAAGSGANKLACTL